MANYYTIRQIMDLTGLTESWVRRLLRNEGVTPAYKEKRTNYYNEQDVTRLFGKHFDQMSNESIPGTESRDYDDLMIRRGDYDQLMTTLGVLRGKLDELEHSREYWERERSEYRQEKAALQARIRELEEKIEAYHTRPSFWRRLFRG